MVRFVCVCVFSMCNRNFISVWLFVCIIKNTMCVCHILMLLLVFFPVPSSLRENGVVWRGGLEEKQYTRLTRGVLIESIVNVKLSKSQFQTKNGLVLFAKQFHVFEVLLVAGQAIQSAHTHTHRHMSNGHIYWGCSNQITFSRHSVWPQLFCLVFDVSVSVCVATTLW